MNEEKLASTIWWRDVIVAALVTVMIFVTPIPSYARSALTSEEGVVSPYWHLQVRRWNSIIVKYAQSRNLDPDLVAAVIWKESLGDSTARGPTGAVGLMGLKPFPWRPNPEQLENPWTNLFWGARALAHTIRDGEGDIYYALAAYNGGWEKAHQPNTRRYAADVLGHYVRAVAVRNGLPADSGWTAVMVVQRPVAPHIYLVLGPQQELVRYTERPRLELAIARVPNGGSPSATAVVSPEGEVEYQVDVWLITESEGSK
jgi:hypothetical protein